MNRNGLNDRGLFYDRGTIKVVAWACVIIVVSVALTGFINYEITRKAVVDKLKSRDLLVVVDSIAGKIDGRVARAKETASMLAQDPAILQWVNGAEQDERLAVTPRPDSTISPNIMITPIRLLSAPLPIIIGLKDSR